MDPEESPCIGVVGRDIVFVGEVTERSAFNLQLALRHAIRLEQKWAIENEVPARPLCLIVNSSGGDVSAALSLYELMLGSPVPIHSHGTGWVASAATLLLLGGSVRTAGPETRLLLHQVSAAAEGTVSELEVSVAESKVVQGLVAKVYQARTRLTKTAILKLFLQDSWLSASRAKRLGFVHRVLAR